MTTVRGEVSLVPNSSFFFTATASGGSTAGAGLVAGSSDSTLSIHVTDVILSGLTVSSVTFREDTTTVTFLSVDLGLTSGSMCFNHSFKTPFKLAAGKPLQYTATDKVKVAVCGYYAP